MTTDAEMAMPERDTDPIEAMARWLSARHGSEVVWPQHRELAEAMAADGLLASTPPARALPLTHGQLRDHLADLTYRGRNLTPAHADALAEFVLRFYEVRTKELRGV